MCFQSLPNIFFCILLEVNHQNVFLVLFQAELEVKITFDTAVIYFFEAFRQYLMKLP